MKKILLLLFLGAAVVGCGSKFEKDKEILFSNYWQLNSMSFNEEVLSFGVDFFGRHIKKIVKSDDSDVIILEFSEKGDFEEIMFCKLCFEDDKYKLKFYDESEQRECIIRVDENSFKLIYLEDNDEFTYHYLPIKDLDLIDIIKSTDYNSVYGLAGKRRLIDD